MSKFVRASIPFLLLLLSDQLIKYFVISQDLNYYKNYGFLFGLVNFKSPVISVLFISAILIIVMLNLFQHLNKCHSDPRAGIRNLDEPECRVSARHDTLPVGLHLFLAGSVSNFLDRMTRGYVADYLDWKTVMPFWPENFVRFFNLADVFIILGFLFAVLNLRRSGGPVRRNP